MMGRTGGIEQCVRHLLVYNTHLIHTSSAVFAGHSKWANIRHDKAKNDARRLREGLLLAGRIEASVKTKGTEANAQLDTLIERAKKMSVPKKIIDSAIRRGTGESISGRPVSTLVTYEFVGPAGVLFIVLAQTDNKARTVKLVKLAMKEFNASMSPCLYLFQRVGEIVFEARNASETLGTMMDVAIEVGAEDVEEFTNDNRYYDAENTLYYIHTDPGNVFEVLVALKAMKYTLKEVKTGFVVNRDNRILVPEEHARGFCRTIDALDLCSDVLEYWTNAKSLE